MGLHDLGLAVETMKELKKDFSVVMNRYGLGNADVETYCKRENIPVIAKIPNQRSIAESYSEGKLLYHEIGAVKDALDKIIAYIDERYREYAKRIRSRMKEISHHIGQRRNGENLHLRHLLHTWVPVILLLPTAMSMRRICTCSCSRILRMKLISTVGSWPLSIPEYAPPAENAPIGAALMP
ncbi:MAG: hypothetical protein U5N56_06385 [Candidatus Marinimicrobia bacterium]|nr:hypothetical protein [Candidatus Neomarinimicrobiota bacterium]